MRAVMTAEASAALDAEHADSLPVLMHRAGHAVAIAAAQMGIGYGHRVVVLAGPGNNGGDGYVAAAALRRRGVAVEVRALAPPRRFPATDAAESARQAGVPIRSFGPPDGIVDLIIDGLFGGGYRGDLAMGLGDWAATGAPVLAIDVPSGVDATTGTADPGTLAATRTVTFHSLKVGHLIGDGADLSGAVQVADIGLDGGEAVFSVVEASDAPRPDRPRTAHKWSAGSVAVAGGDLGMTGAALLCARASLASGAGAVSINANAATVGVYRSAPELLTSVRSSTDAAGAEEWLKHDDRFDVLVVGPGLGPDHADFVKALVESERSLVLDAGALAAARLADITRRSAPTVLTPHAAEFSRMARRPATYEAARAVAEQCGATVLLKGSPTFVADPDDLVAVTSGGPELATIGTGDVLAGMVAAFMARGLDGPVAARSAAFWHGQAGKELAASGTVTADRLIDEVRRWVW